MTVVQRQSKAITASVLRTEDPDTPANQIIYDIMQPPSFGQLVLADNMTHSLRRFTQVSVHFTGYLMTKCIFLPHAKGDLISDSFSLWLKCPKIDAKSLPWALFIQKEDAQGSDLAPIFGDLSQSKFFFDFKPPFVRFIH